MDYERGWWLVGLLVKMWSVPQPVVAALNLIHLLEQTALIDLQPKRQLCLSAIIKPSEKNGREGISKRI